MYWLICLPPICSRLRLRAFPSCGCACGRWLLHPFCRTIPARTTCKPLPKTRVWKGGLIMKRFLSLLVALLLLFPAAALAQIDLSGLSYDELVALKDQINKAMWESKEWQEVTVAPRGVYEGRRGYPRGPLDYCGCRQAKHNCELGHPACRQQGGYRGRLVGKAASTSTKAL